MPSSDQTPTLPDETDALVIGAGAGGAAAAWALARKGVKVTLVDAGPAFSADEYKVSDDNWELQEFPHKDGSQGRYEIITGQPLEERWSSLRNVLGPRKRKHSRTTRGVLEYSHVRGIGGTTLHFTGWMHRLRPEAFEMNTRFGVAADWPVSYAELEPYYLQAERMVGIAGTDTDAGRPRSGPYPTPAHPLSMLSQTIREGGHKVGLDFVQNPVASPSVVYAGRPACNYCNCCFKGCPLGDKGSADLVFVNPALESGNCTVHARHTLVDLVRNDNDTLSAAVIADAKGVKHTVKARHFVLSAGAIETPRLLLTMDGLANESGLVGQNFMETLSGSIIGLHPDQIGSHRGYPEDAVCWDLNTPDAINGVIGGGVLFPTVASSNFIGPSRYAQRLVEGFGSQLKRDIVATFGKAAGVGVMCESLPNPKSFVSLSDQHHDEFGRPIARINSFLPNSELQRLAFVMQKAEDVLLASGVPEVLERFTTYEQFLSTHLFGTCRMGNNPETSVVNASQRSHRWQNLWISDTSVFPSSGSGEGPSLTAHALSIRMADAMIDAMRQAA